MLSKSIGSNIKQLRIEKGLSQEDLASMLFITRQTVSNYETGRSYPDVDMLEEISRALDVELPWLLYGKPASESQKAKRTATCILFSIFSGILILTLVLLAYTGNLKQVRLIPMPNILTRLILAPLTMAALGATLLQLIDCFIGINLPGNTVRKIGRISTACVIGTNLILVLPYLVWCFSILIQTIFHPGSISMFFPRIPIYQEAAYFFLNLMYSFPYVYLFIGMALWLFYTPNVSKKPK